MEWVWGKDFSEGSKKELEVMSGSEAIKIQMQRDKAVAEDRSF